MSDFVFKIFGNIGVSLFVGLIVFLVVFRYSNSIFGWIEEKSHSNREYVLDKLEKMFVEVNPDKVTLILLGVAIGPGILIFSILSFVGFWKTGIIFAIIFCIIGWKIPKPVVDFFVERRITLFENQMVDALQLLGNGLRAGQSLPQSFAMVVDELPAPVSEEFNYLLQQNRVGMPIEDCLVELEKRIPTEDNEMFVTSVNILLETGGNLPETFDTIVSVIRERIRVKQKISTYIAQGMTQGAVLFSMPFLVGIGFTFSDPEMMKSMVTTPWGIIATILVVLLDLLGGFLILKIVKIKV